MLTDYIKEIQSEKTQKNCNFFIISVAEGVTLIKIKILGTRG